MLSFVNIFGMRGPYIHSVTKVIRSRQLKTPKARVSELPDRAPGLISPYSSPKIMLPAAKPQGQIGGNHGARIQTQQV
jgi:hypothetical protein